MVTCWQRLVPFSGGPPAWFLGQSHAGFSKNHLLSDLFRLTVAAMEEEIMPDDPKEVEKRLIETELENQLRRFGARSSRVLRESLRARGLEWDAQRGTVTIEGYFVRQPLSEHLESVRAVEPEMFEPPERVGTNDVPLPRRKVILSTDTAAISKNMMAIAKGEVAVEDPPRARRALKANEMLSTDQTRINASLKQISAGQLVVVDPDDLNL